MTLASKPPIRRKTSTGMTTAISASDWPRLRLAFGERTLISVALRLYPDIRDSGRPERSERCEEPRFPGVGVVDSDADEVAGAVPYVAARGRPGRAVERRTVQCVLVGLRDILCQVAVPILVELVDVNLLDGEQLRAADRLANRRHDLAVGIRDVAERGGDPRALGGGIAGGANAEHQESAVEHAHDQDQQDRNDERK